MRSARRAVISRPALLAGSHLPASIAVWACSAERQGLDQFLIPGCQPSCRHNPALAAPAGVLCPALLQQRIRVTAGIDQRAAPGRWPARSAARWATSSNVCGAGLLGLLNNCPNLAVRRSAIAIRILRPDSSLYRGDPGSRNITPAGQHVDGLAKTASAARIGRIVASSFEGLGVESVRSPGYGGNRPSRGGERASRRLSLLRGPPAHPTCRQGKLSSSP